MAATLTPPTPAAVAAALPLVLLMRILTFTLVVEEVGVGEEVMIEN